MKFKAELDFRLIAHVELPDHAHLIIDPGKCNLSSIIQKVKLSFSKKVIYALSEASTRIWQTRFWDHVIRDEADMNKHIDYIHFNPVKHGYTASPHEWRFSSFHDYLEAGLYQPNWGETPIHELQGEYGE